MLRKTSLAVMAAVAGAMMAGGLATEASAKNCVPKAAEGTGGTEENAKFQVYEALLQATDWGAWAAWMANGTTPGYKVNTVKYSCKKGGLGVTCRGQTTICKL
ncbi:MAG: hypothetical protein CTY31_00995 [Hyphomicrobium sp.]|nr:MAG: hypothetical protein CTY39_06115 [Hyphomicrobium sp.]PPD01391.1 MAG: hypothetical protein CTY31_00995 [Hyphomicrobium sp.]